MVLIDSGERHISIERLLKVLIFTRSSWSSKIQLSKYTINLSNTNKLRRFIARLFYLRRSTVSRIKSVLSLSRLKLWKTLSSSLLTTEAIWLHMTFCSICNKHQLVAVIIKESPFPFDTEDRLGYLWLCCFLIDSAALQSSQRWKNVVGNGS